MRRSTSGFTLIEMVVVVTIISILASIAVVNFGKVRDKAEAARIATQLHYVEDGVIEALLDGVDPAGFPGMTSPANIAGGALDPYLTSANLSDLPEGMSLAIANLSTGGRRPSVALLIRSDASHESILEELQSMLPRQLDHRAGAHVAWVRIDVGDLAIIPVVPDSSSN